MSVTAAYWSRDAGPWPFEAALALRSRVLSVSIASSHCPGRSLPAFLSLRYSPGEETASLTGQGSSWQ